MSETGGVSETVTFTVSQGNQGRRLIDAQGFTYCKGYDRKDKNGKVVNECWTCRSRSSQGQRKCPGRFTYYPETGEGHLSRDHWEGERCSGGRKVKDEAIRRLKELSQSAQDGDKAIDIVRKLIDELPPETVKLLPTERALVNRVRNYSKAAGVTLGRSTIEDFWSGDEEKDERIDGGGEGDEDQGAANEGSKSRVASSSLKRKLLKKKTPKLKLVDEEGRLLEVPVDRILTAGEDTIDFTVSQNSDRLAEVKPGSRIRSSTRVDDDDNDGEQMPIDSNLFDGGDDDADWDGGDAFNEMESDSGPEIKPRKPSMSRSTKPKTVFTSSKVGRTSRRPKKNAVRSGERCFVCGDELLVSETLSSSEETFRKACVYLNVRTKNEWFQRKSNGHFYSFCESCTDEISKIHELYKNVEEAQSLIFKRVEQVEKRMTEAEILDNWLADASSAKRFAGFREQVLINYRNKLKLRREIRMGTKMGLDFAEIQPITSARMFATDPAETDAFRKTVKSDGGSKSKPKSASATNPAKRGRGRPKKSIKVEDLISEKKPEPNPHFSEVDESPFPDGFDDIPHGSDDNMSVTSEKERKFWVDDPKKLRIRTDRAAYVEDNDNDDGDYNPDPDMIIGYVDADDDWAAASPIADESDSEYNVDEDDDDEEWGKSTAKRRKGSSGTGTRRGRPPGASKTSTAAPRSKSTKERKKPEKSKETTVKRRKVEKPPRKFHRANMEFPDVVLAKDGRLFLSGIEIIKNPPGVYKRSPDSVSFSCGACEKVVLNFSGMKSHICGHHLLLYKCSFCGKQISDARNLQRHIKARHSSAQKYPCHICGKPLLAEFGTRNYNFHIWYHLSEEEKMDPKYKAYVPFQKREKDPRWKKTNHGQQQSYMCSYCPKSFNRIDSFRKHELTHTGAETPPESFQCQYCGKFYKSKKGLRTHSEICGAKPTEGVESLMKFPCLQCDVVLKSRKIRILHMRKFHSNPVSHPFACPKCPRRFTSRDGFKQHKRRCVEGGSTATSSSGGRRKYNRRRQHQNIQEESQSPQPSTSGDGSQFAVVAPKLEAGMEMMTSHPIITRGGGGGVEGGAEHQSSMPLYSLPNANSSTATAASLLTQFGYNMFANHPAPGGNPFQPHQSHHQQ